eukprot:scaffold284026_cov38-Tisochrysis_lutea.AAC.5
MSVYLSAQPGPRGRQITELDRKLGALDPIPTVMGGDFNCVENGAHDSQRLGEALYASTHGEKWKALTKAHKLRDAHHTLHLGPN